MSTDSQEERFDDLLEDAAASEPLPSGRTAGWKRVFTGNRALWIVAAVAVLCLIAGMLAGRFILSPADAAANADPPAPGLITVPVEFGPLSNDVTIRGEVGYADAAEVTIDTADISGPAVVTGQVPAVGSDLGPLSVALEIGGRPVILLPGDLPAYRTLRFGVSGPDVVQLKAALAAVGIDPGDQGSDRYDAATAAAVAQLYTAVGYPTPPLPEGADDAVRAAEDGIRHADQAIAAARSDLAQAGAGPSAVDVRQADNVVNSARRMLEAARAEVPPDPLRIADLQDAYDLAVLQRQQLDLPANTSGQRAGLDSAFAQATAARAELDRAREAALVHLPASEVLFLNQLPRRVDAVAAQRGTILTGPAMTVSGATLQLTGSAAEADARLLTVGSVASFELPGGGTHRAVITELEPGENSDSRWSITFEPDPLTAEQIFELQGRNVRVAIPVGATEGDVLSVPLAALTAGPGGEARIEVVTGDPRDGEDADTRLVVVETGLAAGGYVEVRPVEGTLEPGELVVVGE